LIKLEEAETELRSRAERLEKGETLALMPMSFGLALPQSYEKAYDQIIKMLEMSSDEIIKLSSDEFACFVMDDWDWKESFKNTTMSYK